MKVLASHHKRSQAKFTIPFKRLSLCMMAIFGNGDALAEEFSADQYIAKNVEFDPSFLNIGSSDKIDLSRFANGAAALPGIYQAEVFVNNQSIGNQSIEIKTREDKTVFPCITSELIKSMNLDYSKLPEKTLDPFKKGEKYLDLERQIPDSRAVFNSSEQRLDIFIPQIYVEQIARGSVNPALWDSGIPAAVLGYDINTYSSRSNGVEYNSAYAGMNAGLNIGAWYLRHNGYYSWTQNGIKEYSSINTYLQRDISQIKGRAIIGESNTSGQVFDTLPYKGVGLVSDERMLPESLRGYAPDIRGIAHSNARVTVRQGEQIIYQKSVTPGAFLINDLYPTGYGGDLQVTVREADGSESVFTVPYASVAQLLRPGADRYEMTAGQLHTSYLKNSPTLFQSTYQRGLTNSITGYGGLQASQNYSALQLGAALGTTLGAFSLDATHATTRIDSQENSTRNMRGQSYKVSYSKLISETNSNLSIATYRFSSDGYMDFITAMQTREASARNGHDNIIWRAKNRVTVTASQGLPDSWGQLYISSSVQNYWNRSGSNQQFQIGYNNSYKSISYGINASKSYSGVGDSQNTYMLNISLPLGRSDQSHTPQMRMALNHDTDGNTGEQVGISGSAGTENQYSYGATLMNGNKGVGSSGSLNGMYRSPYAALSSTVGTGKHYQNASFGLSGTVVAHSGGATFTPYNSETIALVQAQGAEGASVSSYPGIKIDRWGYAVVPYLNPYQMNEINIDPKGISGDVELDNTAQKVAPFAGAVVKLKYNAKRGTPVLIKATLGDDPIPFGADVFDINGNSVGSVGQGGQIYARVVDTRGDLLVRWGDETSMQCTVSYLLAPTQVARKQNEIQQFRTECRAHGSVMSSSGTVVANNKERRFNSEG